MKSGYVVVQCIVIERKKNLVSSVVIFKGVYSDFSPLQCSHLFHLEACQNKIEKHIQLRTAKRIL